MSARLPAALEPIDTQLARLLERLGADADTALAGALCSHWRGRGHSCLPLRALPRALASPEFPPAPLPPAERLLEALRRSPWVAGAADADPRAPRPLVLDGENLYLWRYFVAERELAAALAERLARPPREEPLGRRAELAPLWRRLFPESGESPDLQALAAWGALTRDLFLISGGPGTGKTRSVARLAVAAGFLRPGLQIRLAAPTGKAAQRLDETLSEQWRQLEAELAGSFVLPPRPAGAATLHRLLGYRPRLDRFGHHAGQPLEGDLFVVDEASMVDLLLMNALVAALPPASSLILLGDRDQLASVETGSVFADLARLAPAHSADGLVAELEGGPPAPAGPGKLDRHAVVLQKSHRFAERPEIEELARAVREGDAERAWRLLEKGDGDGRVARQAHDADPARLLAPLAPRWASYRRAASPADALDRLGGFRLLCALRRGPFGVEGLNAAVERLLADALDPSSAAGPWYHQRPILIRSNDYELELFNGDLGVLWREGGQLWAFFDQGRRRLPLAKLPRHDSAWAMTVHQSQGSEFDQVLLVLPKNDIELVTRELLYTGLTRARQQVDLVVSRELLTAALGRSARRHSGLAARLEQARS